MSNTHKKKSGYYVEQANQYIDDVLNGRQVACRFVKLACERQKKDLEKAKESERYPYYFDTKSAEKICRFAEMLQHVRGDKAQKKETLNLEPWQCFIYTTIFGWLKKSNDKRRFRDVYIEVAKKNGKSFMSIPPAIYMLALDGEMGAEVLLAASQKDQTKHVFDPALSIVKDNKDLAEGVGLNYSKYAIFQQSTNSKLYQLVRDSGGNIDGINPHCSIIDELHAHKTRDTHDAITSATGSRSQPLIWRITTAGVSRSSICYEQHMYVKKILLGTHEDDTYFGIIYTLDDEDDWRDPKVWVKSNPNLGVSLELEAMEKDCNMAIGSSASLNNFLTKRLNVWVNADSAWMNMNEFNQCKDESLKMEDFKDYDCYVACDLASKLDFVSVCYLFVKKIKDKTHYYAFLDHYLNERAIEETNNDMIDGWVHDGWVISTPGNMTDYETIKDDIVRNHSKYKIKNIKFDPKEATYLRQKLEELNIESEEHPQNLSTMNEPTKELEALVFDKRFHWDGNPVFEWMISNVVVKVNAKGQVYPKREINQKEAKIDGAIATIMALSGAMKGETKNKSINPQIFIFG